jgi:HK97 family phage major capsid protein
MKDLVFRNVTLTREDISEEDRTVRLAFSSEEPYQRSFGMEVLSHKDGDVQMDFLKSGSAPLLLDHDQEKQIGVIETAEIENQSVGRATVRFSKSELGEEIFRDVVDGIRKNISVGYAITEKAIETRNGEKFVVCKWFPQEVSVVAIPADKTVGIGRSDEISEDDLTSNNNNNKELIIMENQKNHEVETSAVDLDSIKNETVKVERARISEITSIAQRHGVSDLANSYISEGKSVDEFRAAVLDKLANKPAVAAAAPVLGMSEKEMRNYSLGRAVKAMLTGDWSDAGLELEASRAVAKECGKFQTKSNVFVPADYLNRAAGANATTTASGQFIGVDHMGGSFMDVLFNATIANRLGVQYASGLRGDVEIPKFTAASSAAWTSAEGADGSITKPTQGSVTMSPKTLIGLVEFTRKMALQSDPFIEGILRSHITKVLGQAIDTAIFAAGGSGAPVGLLGSAAVTAWESVPDNTAYTYADIYELIKNVDVANALTDNCKFAMSPTVAALLATRVKDSNTAGIYLLQDGVMAGHEVVTSNNVGNNIIFGDFSNVMVGSWSTLELAVDTSQLFLSGGTLIRAITDMDVAVLRGEAFSGYKAANVDPTP